MIIWGSRELLESGSYLVLHDGCVFKLNIVYPSLILNLREKLLLQREKAAGILANQIENAVRSCHQNLKEKTRTLSQYQMDHFILRAEWLPWKLGKEVEFSIHGKCVQTLPLCLSLKVCDNRIWHKLVSSPTGNQLTGFDAWRDINEKNKKMPSKIWQRRRILKQKLRAKVEGKNVLFLAKNGHLAVPHFTKGMTTMGANERFLPLKQKLLSQHPRVSCRIKISESGSLIEDVTMHPEVKGSTSRGGSIKEDEMSSGKACQYQVTEFIKQGQNQTESEDGDSKEVEGTEKEGKEQNAERRKKRSREERESEGDINCVNEECNEKQDIIKHTDDDKKCTYVIRDRRKRKQNEENNKIQDTFKHKEDDNKCTYVLRDRKERQQSEEGNMKQGIIKCKEDDEKCTYVLRDKKERKQCEDGNKIQDIVKHKKDDQECTYVLRDRKERKHSEEISKKQNILKHKEDDTKCTDLLRGRKERKQSEEGNNNQYIKNKEDEKKFTFILRDRKERKQREENKNQDIKNKEDHKCTFILIDRKERKQSEENKNQDIVKHREDDNKCTYILRDRKERKQSEGGSINQHIIKHKENDEKCTYVLRDRKERKQSEEGNKNQDVIKQKEDDEKCTYVLRDRKERKQSDEGNKNQDVIKHKENDEKCTYVLRDRKERKQSEEGNKNQDVIKQKEDDEKCTYVLRDRKERKQSGESTKNLDIIKHKKEDNKCPYEFRLRKERKQHKNITENKGEKRPIKIARNIAKFGEVQSIGLEFQSLEMGIVKKNEEANENLDIAKAEGVDEEDKCTSSNADKCDNEYYAAALIRNYRYDQFSKNKSPCALLSQKSHNLFLNPLSTKGYNLRPHPYKSWRFASSSGSQKCLSCSDLRSYSSPVTSKPDFHFRRRKNSQLTDTWLHTGSIN